MRNAANVFHLAIPCGDLDEAQAFYVDRLGCRLARRYDDRITLDFFGDQVVCHLAPDKIDTEPEMYPRHFGVTFRRREDFDAVLERARAAKLPFFAEPFVRFEGRPESPRSFMLRDPSNTLLEFKFYANASMMY